MGKLSGAWLTTNRTCNNKCSFCYAQHATGKDMNLNDAIKCVDSIASMNIKHVVLIGGEPSIYPQIIPLLKYIKSKDLSASIATNGRKFSNYDFAEQIVTAGVSGVNISIKGSSEEEYIINTKCNGFLEMVAGYHNLIKAGVNPIVSYVITNNDIRNIEKLVNTLVKNDMDNIIFQFVKPVVEPNSPPIMRLQDMGTMVGDIHSLMSNFEIKYKIEISFPLCLIDEAVLSKLIEEDKINTCCHVPAARGIVFDCDFKLLPCNHFIDFHYSDIEAGKMGVDKINEVFYSDIARKFRQTAGYYPSEKCITCRKWDICGGGCFTRWLFEDPKEIIRG